MYEVYFVLVLNMRNYENNSTRYSFCQKYSVCKND